MLTINKKYFPVISDFRQIKWKAVLRYGLSVWSGASALWLPGIDSGNSNWSDRTSGWRVWGKETKSRRMTNSVCRNSITPLPDTATKVSTLFKFQRILKLSSAAAVAARSGSKAKVKSSRKRGHVSLVEDLNSLNELLKKWAFPNNPRRNYCYGDHDWECWVRFFGIQISLKWKLD